MYQYVYPLETDIPSDQFHSTIRKAPYDLKVTNCGNQSYASSKNITLEATEYLEGASSSDERKIFLIFETQKTSEQLTAIKTIIDTQKSNYTGEE